MLRPLASKKKRLFRTIRLHSNKLFQDIEKPSALLAAFSILDAKADRCEIAKMTRTHCHFGSANIFQAVICEIILGHRAILMFMRLYRRSGKLFAFNKKPSCDREAL
jgi:hypothetical protein